MTVLTRTQSTHYQDTYKPDRGGTGSTQGKMQREETYGSGILTGTTHGGTMPRTPGSSPREIWTTRKSSSIYWHNLTWTWHPPLSPLQSLIPEAAKRGQTTSL